MDEMTRIVWSGLTGRTGREAIEQAPAISDVEIVMGLKRDLSGADDVNFSDGITWMQYERGMDGLFGLINTIKLTGANVMVDFSHPDVFERIVVLAVRTHVPLISGTSGLSDRQMAMLYDATNQIPVFRGGNFRFKVKKFIDEAVELAERERGQLDLYENFWEGKELPSETSKVLQNRILKATGRRINIHSSATFAQGNWISDWELQVHRRVSPTAMSQDKLHCRVIGYNELAHDVLEIAKIMRNKPIKKGEFYDLDEIWDEIPAEAKIL